MSGNFEKQTEIPFGKSQLEKLKKKFFQIIGKRMIFLMDCVRVFLRKKLTKLIYCIIDSLSKTNIYLYLHSMKCLRHIKHTHTSENL